MQSGTGIDGLDVSTIVPKRKGAELFRVERRGGGGGVTAEHVEVLKVSFLDRVLHRLEKQIIETSFGVHVEEIIKVFSQDRDNDVVEQNHETSVWHGSGGASVRCARAFWTKATQFLRDRAVPNGNPEQYFYELLFWQILASVFMRRSTAAFGIISGFSM